MLDYDKEYAQCQNCTRVFVVSVFSQYPVCNYDRMSLTKIGKEYPKTKVKVGQ